MIKKNIIYPYFFLNFFVFFQMVIYLYIKERIIYLKIKFIMEVMIAILLFGILIFNALFGLNLISRIDNLIKINEKERMADE